MTATYWDAASKIYAEGIATGYASFEKNIPSYKIWADYLGNLIRFG